MANLKSVYLIGGGSRGDVQPLISLGQRLKKEYGYRIVLFAGIENERFCEVHGFELVPLFSVRELIKQPKIKKALEEASDDSLQVWEVLGQQLSEHAVDDAMIVYNALKDDGSAVAVVASSTHLQLAYALRRKLPHLAYIALLLQPLCPSKYYPPCFVDVKALPPPASFKDSPALVRLSMQALQQAMLNLLLALMPESTNLKLHNDVWLAVTAQLGDQNRKVCAAFGLEQEAKSVEDRAKLAVKRFRNEEEGYRTLYAISKHFFKRPPTDLPSSVTDAVTGSLFLKQVEDHLEVDERSDKLKEFLSNAEEPPIYIGFGSMSISKPAQVVRTLLGALQLARKRAVILRGWAELSTECIDAQQDMALLEYAAKHVLFADSVPHDWIMPRCSINVIHGGVGTTSAAVRAGKPLIVMPFAFDQAFMADRVVEHGIAYRAPSVAKCSAKKLASLIKKVSGNKKMYERAAKLAELVRQEDGPGKAVEMVQIEIEKTQRAAAVSGEAEAEP